MNRRSIFFDDWRDCLRAHFIHVIRVRDTANESSLYGVLLDTGFTEDEIEAIRQVAWAGMEPSPEPSLEETRIAVPDAINLEPTDALPIESTQIAVPPGVEPALEAAEPEAPPKPDFFQPSLF